jgi:predicted nucleotidyltransferase/HEPN domain-containing protein
MKTSIEHLPEEKQAEVHEIVKAVNNRFPAEMIILFGSFARGDWVDDRYTENGTIYEYKSDYDILVVVDSEVLAIRKESKKRWQYKLRRDTGLDTPLNVIFHGIDYLNSEIEDGSYFFVDVLKEGIMLYDSGNFQLSAPKPLSPGQRKQKAQRYFDKWFKNASSFFTQYEFAFNIESFDVAAFLLHQTTERFFACLILVYTDYKPKIHDLEKLNKQVCKLDCRFKIIFPRSTDEEERLFQLLKKAYIDSRYKLEYKITKEELEYLSLRVEKLRNLTELACKEKIERFEG